MATSSIALVGCGRWGQNILRDLVKLGSEVTVVARSEETRQRATSGGASAVVSEIEELKDVAGVVVAVPTNRHAEVLDEALEVGVPVFVEKPLTSAVTDAERFATRDDVFVMDKWRYHPGILAIASMAAEGVHGPLSGIHTRRHSNYNPHDDVDAIWILAPHDLSIVLEILGRIPAAVAATGESDGTEAVLVGLLEDGVVIEVSSRSPIHRREIVARFAEAVVSLPDGYSTEITVNMTRPGREPRRETVPIGETMPLELELAAFVDHLNGGPPPKSSAAEGALIVRRIQELRDLAGLRT